VGHPLGRLLRYSAAHRSTVRWATACSIINKVFDLAPPVLIGMAIDLVVEREGSWIAQLGIDGMLPQLWALAGLTVLIWGLESIFEYAYQVLWRNLAQTLQHELRTDAYSHVQELDLSWFEDRTTGGLMAILNDDVNQLERFLDGGANDLLQVATTVIVVGASFFALAPGVAVLSFLPVPAILWGSFRFQRRIAPRYADVRAKVGDVNSRLANNLGGIVTIKSFATEEREVERIREASQAYRLSNRSAIALSSAFAPLIRMAIVLGFTGTLVYGGWLTQTGALGVGVYSVLVFMTQRLLWPLTRLGTTVDLYQRAMASTTRVMNVLDARPAITSGPRRLSTDTVAGEILFEDVRFAYSPGGPAVIDGISMVAKAGQTTAIVGATGAGKSTLLKLLLRLYDVDAGCITLDGVDLRELNLRDLRQAIGLVSQEGFIFDGTIRENLAYARPDADDASVRAAADAAEATEFIDRLPDGYDAIVGERGQRLSGGQRQRLSIARAVLKDPPILVLDEATSSVDNETEAAIQRSLARISVGRTTLIIAHRLSTIRNADNIYVLQAGRVAEEGTHSELLDRGGLYAGFWRVQTGEQTATADAAPG
jgi:ATP-binding cassette subfamily B protein